MNESLVSEIRRILGTGGPRLKPDGVKLAEELEG